MTSEITLYICSECSDVSQRSAIDQSILINIVIRVVFFYLIKLSGYIVTYHIEFAIALYHFIGAEFDTIHIDHDRTLDPSSAAIRHPSPVLEGRVYQLISRDDTNRLVPILDLDRMQCDINDITISSKLRCLYPIPYLKKIIRCDLHA